MIKKKALELIKKNKIWCFIIKHLNHYLVQSIKNGGKPTNIREHDKWKITIETEVLFWVRAAKKTGFSSPSSQIRVTVFLQEGQTTTISHLYSTCFWSRKLYSRQNLLRNLEFISFTQLSITEQKFCSRQDRQIILDSNFAPSP